MRLRNHKGLMQHENLRWILLLVLGFALFTLGNREVAVKAAIENCLFVSSSKVLGYRSSVDYRLVSMGFRLLYCGLSLAIIQVYVINQKAAQLALGLYNAVLLLMLLLYGISEIQHFEPLHTVAFRIDTLIISPMPIVLIISALNLLPAAIKNNI